MKRFSDWRKVAAATLVALGGAAWLASQSSPMTTLQNPPQDADSAYLVRFGLTDQVETKWDGTVEAIAGEVVKVIGYQMRVGDLVHPPARWEASSRNAFLFQRRPHDEGWLKDVPGPVILSPSIFVYTRGGDALRLRFLTAQGDFELSARDLPPDGVRSFLNGRVSVERTTMPLLAGRQDKALPGRESSFYYVRVLQQDSQVAWGSPIWVSRR